ncbi:MAG TPA: hypothetical protein VMU24_05915 [Candidatus Acidoferrales bacterium]|nr:hypothetical protein [Candidatus Acidoferrales bacterium]
MPRVFTSGHGPRGHHHHHYSFWLLLLASVAILLSTHFALFHNHRATPPDAINSPDAVLIAVVAAGIVILGGLLHSEIRKN